MSQVRRKTETKNKVRDVQFPLIYQASELIDDEYWKGFFVELSKGKLSRRVHIDSRYVSHSTKKSSFNYCYEGKTPQEIANELPKLIGNSLLIMSKSDWNKEQEEKATITNKFKDVKVENNWKKMNNKNLRDHLITKFVLKQQIEHNLNTVETQRAYNCITNAMYEYHTHKGNDITMVDGEIVKIEDIIISKDLISNERLKTFEEEIEKPAPKKVFWNKEWVKVCENMYKQACHLLCIDDEPSKKRRNKLVRKTDDEGNVVDMENAEEVGDEVGGVEGDEDVEANNGLLVEFDETPEAMDVQYNVDYVEDIAAVDDDEVGEEEEDDDDEDCMQGHEDDEDEEAEDGENNNEDDEN